MGFGGGAGGMFDELDGGFGECLAVEPAGGDSALQEEVQCKHSAVPPSGWAGRV